MRPNGVLMAQITPRGGRISGTSSIVQLDAWNWEDAVIKENDGIHINWPSTYSRGRWWLGEPNTLKENKNYKEDQCLQTYDDAPRRAVYEKAEVGSKKGSARTNGDTHYQ